MNRACPDFPAAVFRVTVIAAPATGFLASPFSAFSPEAPGDVSRSEPRTTSAEAVKPLVAIGLLPSSKMLMVIVVAGGQQFGMDARHVLHLAAIRAFCAVRVLRDGRRRRMRAASD